MIEDNFERVSYHFKEKNCLIEDDHQLELYNKSIFFTHIQMIPHHGYRPIQGRSMGEMNKHGY